MTSVSVYSVETILQIKQYITQVVMSYPSIYR